MVTAMVTTMGMTLITATQNRGVFQNKQGNCLLLFPTVNRNVFFPTEKVLAESGFSVVSLIATAIFFPG